MPEYTHTLLATLGGQPQVVTCTLDLLLPRFPISEVIVIHPHATQPRLQHSLQCLSAEFVSDRYRHFNRTIHLRSHILRLDEDTLLDDVTDDMSATGAIETIHQLIRDLKRQPRCIHLSVTGGRRLMALSAISAAQLNFKHNIDHIWHIYMPEELKHRLKDGKRMHILPGEQMNLIEIPFVPWKTYFSPAVDDNASAQELLRSQIVEAEEQKRRNQVIDNLTKAQHQVLRLVVQGKTPKEVANQLVISPHTVSSHLSEIYKKCKDAWELDDDYSFDYHFLRERFRKHSVPDE
ncbi:MAG TPA: CRISPR-associated ring nuclease [Ktedonobacteraceae bacterium]|jgi:CRISPR-associated protein Csx14|nr:CRISPR-associated ring nuclease [Ktedonobacteraceae bacterium]